MKISINELRQLILEEVEALKQERLEEQFLKKAAEKVKGVFSGKNSEEIQRNILNLMSEIVKELPWVKYYDHKYFAVYGTETPEAKEELVDLNRRIETKVYRLLLPLMVKKGIAKDEKLAEQMLYKQNDFFNQKLGEIISKMAKIIKNNKTKRQYQEKTDAERSKRQKEDEKDDYDRTLKNDRQYSADRQREDDAKNKRASYPIRST